MNIGNKIKEMRKAANLTQTELGERVGCTKIYIAGLETGQYKNPTIQLLLRISEVCGFALEVNFVKSGTECKELTFSV